MYKTHHFWRVQQKAWDVSLIRNHRPSQILSDFLSVNRKSWCSVTDAVVHFHAGTLTLSVPSTSEGVNKLRKFGITLRPLGKQQASTSVLVLKQHAQLITRLSYVLTSAVLFGYSKVGTS